MNKTKLLKYVGKEVEIMFFDNSSYLPGRLEYDEEHKKFTLNEYFRVGKTMFGACHVIDIRELGATK